MNTVDCLLSCGCWKRLRLDLAVPDTLQTCLFHGKILTGLCFNASLYVVKVNTHEWHLRCQTPDCRYGRWFGQSEGSARRANGLHATRYAHLGGIAYDRVTWDGKGTVYRAPNLDNRRARRPGPPPARKLAKKPANEYPPPPF